MALTIKTNRVPRLLLDWDQLTRKEQGNFDYLTEEEWIGRDFVRYRGVVYGLGEFMPCPRATDASPTLRAFTGWHGYQSDSYFSGVVFCYPDLERDRVIMGTYYA